jgi:putative acetyltransferase
MSMTISPERPDSPDALFLLRGLDDNLNAMPYPPESRHAFSVDKLIQQQVDFFVLRVDGQAAACGGVKYYEGFGEVKRMWVDTAFRGRGLAKAILGHLADHARARGVPLLRLETGIYQPEAIGLYERFGFVRRSPFGDYREDPNSIYFELAL